jgi:hypothetical protein
LHKYFTRWKIANLKLQYRLFEPIHLDEHLSGVLQK